MSTPPESPSAQYPLQAHEQPTGSSPYPDETSYGAPSRTTSTSAVLGLVFAFLLPVVGLILSIIGITKTGAGKAKGRGLAVAGLIISILGTLFWSFVIIAALAGIGAAVEEAGDTVVVAPADEAAADVENPADAPVEDAGAEAPPADPSSFEALTPEAWAEIVRDPSAHEGDAISVFAEVFQLDANTGAEAFLANAGASQPAGEFELDDLAFVSAPGDGLAQVAEGDVIRVDAVIDGSQSYDTLMGAENTVVSLRAVAIEQVGYLDLTPDITLGAAEPQEFGGVDVPLTVVNSGDATYNYSITVTAVSPDGATQYATTSAYVDNLTPGQSAQESASFFEDVPEDAVYDIATVDRYTP